MVHWKHVSTVFWKFHAISKNVRQRSVGQTVQKLEPIIILALCFDPRDVWVHSRARIQRFWWLMEVGVSLSLCCYCKRRSTLTAVSTVFRHLPPGLSSNYVNFAEIFRHYIKAPNVGLLFSSNYVNFAVIFLHY